MSVGIDLTAMLPTSTGVESYLQQLVQVLAEVDDATRYTVFVNREDRRLFAGRLPPNFRVAAWCFRPRPMRLAFQQGLLPALAALCGIDVLHSPAFIMPLVRGSSRHLLTVYDMTFFSHPECHEALHRSRPYLWGIVRSLRRAHLVTVPSMSTRDQVLRYVPEVDSRRVRVVPPGIGGDFAPMPHEAVAAVRAGLGLKRPYLLYVGTIEPRKNLLRLFGAYRRLVAEHGIAEDLVLAGRLGWGYGLLLENIASSGLEGRVRRLGYVPQRDLPALLTGARVFVYPSLAEGFGFPPLEAMACGVPTVASRSTSLAENLEGAAELVPPEDEDALGAAVLRLLSSERLRAERRTAGLERARRFRWQDTAELTLECYRELSGGSP